MAHRRAADCTGASFRDGTVRLFDALAHELERDTGLSPHEYEVLVRSSETPERTQRMSQLADDLAHSRSRLTHTIRRMEERGLVVRWPAPRTRAASTAR